MKKLLAMLKMEPGETPEAFAQRVHKTLQDKQLVDSQGKLKVPQEQIK